MHVASHLLSKYPTPRSLAVASTLLGTLLHATRAAPAQVSALLLAAAPSLRRILAAFPVLLDDFVEISEEAREAGGLELFRACVDVFELPE